jgi:hypothetical protein
MMMSPSFTLKVDVYEDGIAFWPSTRKIFHSNQRATYLEEMCRLQIRSPVTACYVALPRQSLNSHASVRATVNANRSYAFALV